jgi:hypothetical protein
MKLRSIRTNYRAEQARGTQVQAVCRPILAAHIAARTTSDVVHHQVSLIALQSAMGGMWRDAIPMAMSWFVQANEQLG